MSKQEELKDRIRLKFLWMTHSATEAEREGIDKCIEEIINSEVTSVLDEVESKRVRVGMLDTTIPKEAIQSIKERYQ